LVNDLAFARVAKVKKSINLLLISSDQSGEICFLKVLPAQLHPEQRLCDLYSPEECWNYLKAAGCGAD